MNKLKYGDTRISRADGNGPMTFFLVDRMCHMECPIHHCRASGHLLRHQFCPMHYTDRKIRVNIYGRLYTMNKPKYGWFNDDLMDSTI